MTQISSSFQEIPELRVHYLRAGSGTPLVLLHGWPEFSGIWRHNMPALAAEYDVIAPDLRGFGRTEKLDAATARKTTPEVLADDLEALLDALGLERVGIVAHDVGAYVSQTFARRHPDRVAGLVFFNCPYPGIGARWAAPDHLIEIWYQSFHRQPWAAELVGYNRDTCRIYFKHFLSHWAHDPHAFDAVLEEWVDNFMASDNLQGGFDWYEGFAAARIAMMKNPELAPGPISAPTRVLWGGSDSVLRAEWSDRIGEFFPNSEVSVVPEAGHFVHFERPDYANAEMLCFFAGVMGG
jgi:pimeloyl-ACP methyl ester carboxylesterase